ncbi:ATP-dependent helicase/nuclease subunit A, partial [human gut metagenome]
KWVSSASLDYNLILPSEILKGKSYLDWIGMSLCQHNDGKVLREKIAVSNEISKDDNSKWDIKLWKRSDIVVNNEDGKLEEE